MSPHGGEVFIDVLLAHGVDHIFCSPGSEWVPVWEALTRRRLEGEKAPEYINCRHEILAVTMAAGYAKATGRLPAVLLHASVGTLHGAMAIRAAYREEVPMLICAGDSSGFGEDENDRGEGWRWSRHLSDPGGPETLARPFVKWSGGLASIENLLGFVYRGCSLARAYPPGPVFLSIPWELLLKSVPATRIPASSPAPGLPQPSLAVLNKIAEQLLQSQNPVILTEHAGTRPETVARLMELAELLAIPVFEAMRPEIINFPKQHPLYAGGDAAAALQEADVVFIVGGINPWETPSAFPNGSARVILLDENTLHERQPYWGYRIDLSLTADIGQGLAALVDLIRPGIVDSGPEAARRQARLEHWRAKNEQLLAGWEKEALAGKTKKPIAPKWFFYMVDKLLPDKAIVLEETITHHALIFRYLQHVKPGSYLNATSGGLGLGMGQALGVKLARKDSPVIFFVGDGTFNYSPVLACLGLCQEYHLPILTVVLNNGGYLAMRRNHLRHFPEGWAARNNAFHGVAITPPPDYRRIAEAFDAYGEKLEDPQEIEPALNRAWRHLEAGKAVLLDVVLDPRV